MNEFKGAQEKEVHTTGKVSSISREAANLGRLLILENAFEKGSPLLCFVAAYIVLEHGRDALKNWSDSRVRCTELLAQGRIIPALF